MVIMNDEDIKLIFQDQGEMFSSSSFSIDLSINAHIMLFSKYLRRPLRVPWTARRSNQSVLKEINPEYSLEGLILKLKLQYIWPHDRKSQLMGEDPDAGRD